MSTFLGFESFLIPIGSSIQNVQDTITFALTSRGWRIVEATVPYTSLVGDLYSDAYPLANAFDNTRSGTWSYVNPVANGMYIGVQMPSVFTPVKVVVGCTDNPAYAPLAISIDWSDDGVTWTTPVDNTFSDLVWSIPGEIKTFTLAVPSAHLYWRMKVVTKAAAVDCGINVLKFIDATGNYPANYNSIKVIPPASEQIGNAYARGVLGIEFNSDNIQFCNFYEILQPSRQIIRFTPNVAGAVTYSITINGQTVSQDPATVNEANTPEMNLRYLYEAVKGSSNSEFLNYAWSWDYPAPQNADDNTIYLSGYRLNTYTTPPTISVSQCSGQVYGIQSSVGVQDMLATGATSDTRYGNNIRIDRLNGFVYYLQVNARGIGLATKTNSDYYGPLHGCWADHALAISSMPTPKYPELISPVELVIGNSQWAADQVQEKAYASHLYMFNLTEKWAWNSSYTYYWYNNSFGKAGHPGSMAGFRYAWQDAQNSYFHERNPIDLYGGELFGGDSLVGNDYQILRVGNWGDAWDDWSSYAANLGYNSYGQLRSGILSGLDWYRFRGSALSENLLLAADYSTQTLLAVALDNTTTPSAISLTSSIAFASSGYVIIENEIIKYTGISGNTLVGITRAMYGTSMQKHFVGDAVQQGLWFTVINGGALLTGYNKPS